MNKFGVVISQITVVYFAYGICDVRDGHIWNTYNSRITYATNNKLPSSTMLDDPVIPLEACCCKPLVTKLASILHTLVQLTQLCLLEPRNRFLTVTWHHDVISTLLILEILSTSQTPSSYMQFAFTHYNSVWLTLVWKTPYHPLTVPCRIWYIQL